jgi:uncharacterized membrane protein YsdA (DUF1294 family)
VPENPRLILLIALVVWYLAWGAITLLAYGRDKRAARLDHRRVPEARLRRLELLGGAFGAAVAQQMFRHKTSKPGFRAITLLIAAMHGAVLCGTGWWALSG